MAGHKQRQRDYVQFPQIQWPHALTTFPTTLRKFVQSRHPHPETVHLTVQAHITQGKPTQSIQKYTKVYKVSQAIEPTNATQAKQSRQTAEPVLPQIKWNTDSIELNGKTHKLPITKDYMLKEYSDVFKGIGTLPGGPYHIRLKEQYRPVQQPPRLVPVAMQTAYKAELDRLTKEGIITEVKEHTEWINSIVPEMKSNGSLRLV